MRSAIFYPVKVSKGESIMLKILITSPTYPPFNSGLGNAVAQQATFLAAAGHQVVVATGALGQHQKSRSAGGITVRIFEIEGAYYLFRPIRGEIGAYVNFLRENDWDVVILNAWQNWATDLAISNIDEISGKKILYSHCVSTNEFFKKQPIRSLVRFLAWRPYWCRMKYVMPKLNGVIFLASGGSDSRFDDFKRLRGAQQRVWILQNALSPASSKALLRPPRALAQRDRLIAVGSYHWLKGFDFVLRAYAASRACNVIPLHFFGQEANPFVEKLRRLSERLKIDPEYIFFNIGISGEALQAEYDRALLVLSGSYTECQPLALLDGSVSATPFIARATGCISTMRGGVSVGTFREMSSKIDEFMENGGYWRAVSNEARVAAVTIYNPDVVAKKLKAIVEGET